MPSRRHHVLFWALFVALMATAVSLGPYLAHLFELPNKIGLARDDYLVVQHIYNGWNQFAWPLLVQLAALLVALVAGWNAPQIRPLVLIAIVGFVAAQVIFWTFTMPANIATEQWTALPENWEGIRARWEYSHAAGAVSEFVVLIALVFAALLLPRHKEIVDT